jgi:hypothetical protein
MKTTDAVAQSAMGLAANLLGYAFPIDNIDDLQRDLQNDYLNFKNCCRVQLKGTY